MAASAVVGGTAIAGAAPAHSAHKVVVSVHQAAKAPVAPKTYGAPRGPRQTLLTGADLASATAAALAAQPGATVVRAEQGGPQGAAFEVHLKKADGSPVTVLLNSSFSVIGTETGFGPHGGRPDGRPPFGHGDPAMLNHGPDETLLTGADLASATAAAQASQPGATVVRAETNNNGSAYEVHMKKADGTYVTVLLNSSFVVTGTEADFGHHPGGPQGTPPPGAPDFQNPPPAV
jgi:uncharacterized membrane protein YkoI